MGNDYFYLCIMTQNNTCIKCGSNCNEENSLVLNLENDESICICETCLNGRITKELIDECMEKYKDRESEKINNRYRSN